MAGDLRTGTSQALAFHIDLIRSTNQSVPNWQENSTWLTTGFLCLNSAWHFLELLNLKSYISSAKENVLPSLSDHALYSILSYTFFLELPLESNWSLDLTWPVPYFNTISLFSSFLLYVIKGSLDSVFRSNNMVFSPILFYLLSYYFI